MDLPNFEPVRLERAGRRLTLTLDRPEALNAFDRELHGALPNALQFAAGDPGSDVVVLTGAGRAFSAGGDIAQMEQDLADRSGFGDQARQGKRIVSALLDIDKPVICRMNGHAIGLGATIALLCDVIFAADTAKIGDPHVTVGLVAGDGGVGAWAHRIGHARAKEFLLTGELMEARRAAEIGLINHAVPAAQLDAAVDGFCDRLLAGAPLAIRWTKLVANLELKRQMLAAMDAGLAYEGLTMRSDDHREAVAAFRDKRQPRFTGR
jgi:enoyl-CoA hydratase